MSWLVRLLVSFVGAAISGFAAGAVVGLAGTILKTPERLAVGLAASLAVACAAVLKMGLPQRDREAPRALLKLPSLIWAAGNGAVLGLAVTTRIGFWIWYFVPIAAFATGPRRGAQIWMLYASVRLLSTGLLAAHEVVAGGQLASDLLECKRGIQFLSTILTGLGAAALLAFSF